jgi:hypothetical protein
VSHLSTADLPRFVPKDIVIGETVEWRKELDDFPADQGWTLTYYFRGEGTGFDVAGVADGSAFNLTAASSATAVASPGAYYFQAWAVKGSEKHLVEENSVELTASFQSITTATTFDGRSIAKQILDAIDNLMQGKATVDSQRYLIASGVPGFTSQREAERIDPSKLLELRKYYAALVAAENRGRNRQPFRTIKIQFDPTSK